MKLDFGDLPDLSQAEYTIILPHEAACLLIQGTVRQDVRVACISAIKALIETPAESVARFNRRRVPSVSGAQE